MTLSACVVYEIHSGVDPEALYNKLTSGFAHREEGEHIEETLLTDVANVEKTERGVEFTLRYDEEDTRPVRESDDPWYRALRKVTVRVTDQYFILNGYSSKNRAAKQVANVLDLKNDEFEQVEFSSGTILELVAEDAAELNQGTWDNPTDNADVATIWGDIQDSSLYTEFNTEGKPSWTRYESSSHPGREAGMSTNKDSVVFSSGWELPEMEDYIYEKVIPNV